MVFRQFNCFPTASFSLKIICIKIPQIKNLSIPYNGPMRSILGKEITTNNVTIFKCYLYQLLFYPYYLYFQ